MQFVDTHCHLQFEKLSADLPEVLDRAAATNVTKMICVGTTLADSRQAIGFAEEFDSVWAAAGVHPHETDNFLSDNDAGTKFLSLLKQPRVVAAGEIGLDYYKNYSSFDNQIQALRQLVELAAPSGLPFIFHIRDAWADFWKVFDSYIGLKGVVHSFSSGVKQLDAALERGLYIGLNGIMTFTKDHAQLEAARRVPLDRLVLETDAPFLAPNPFRGQVCEPKHVTNTAEFLAGLRNESVADLSKATTDNAQRLFRLE